MKKDQEVQDIQEMESGDSQEEIEEILSQVNIYLGLLGLHLSLSYSLGLHLSLSYSLGAPEEESEDDGGPLLPGSRHQQEGQLGICVNSYLWKVMDSKCK